jgi:IMP dehydrogenase/GMP reductase
MQLVMFNLLKGKTIMRKLFLVGLMIISSINVFGQEVEQDTILVQELEEVVVSSRVIDLVKERVTPVAATTIKASEIALKVGNLEFPEIMNRTPGVYATKQGGGYGDSRISLRGFDQRNTSFLINGQPVNDMENGWVYWSNWQGLTDVSSGIQIQRGLGVPNVSCLQEVISVAKTPVMADGGIRTSGDISKALALGSSSVMLGSLLAGTEEAPGQIMETTKGLYKRYRGSASLETKVTHGQQARNVEGESTTIPYKGGVKFIINGLLDGVKSALSYGGASSLKEFKPPYVVVTNSGIAEAKPHLL